VANLGPVSNASERPAVDAKSHETVLAIRSSAAAAREGLGTMPAQLHPVERKIRIWIMQQERNRQRERRRPTSMHAAARPLSDTGAPLTRGEPRGSRG
jgi:hypothetical protein